MRRQSRSRQLFLPVLSLTFVWAALGIPTFSHGQEGGSINRIEEDWELVVGEPDASSNAPQVTCMMSPTDGDDALYATFELNYQSSPEFVAGGMQLQTWNWETSLSTHKFPNGAQMNTDNETVTWTQRMDLNGCTLQYEVLNGNSTTWGNFGGQGYLRATADSCVGSLSGYSPATSVANSGVSFASNRVVKLILKEVRYYANGQLVHTDTADRVAWER